MTGQHRKPGGDGHTFLVRPVDADTVREAIAGVAAKAINDAAATVRKIREWCDQAESGAYCSHDAPPLRECETCELVSQMAGEVRSLLPPVPEAAGEVEMEDDNFTRDDREYPGGTDSGN